MLLLKLAISTWYWNSIVSLIRSQAIHTMGTTSNKRNNWPFFCDCLYFLVSLSLFWMTHVQIDNKIRYKNLFHVFRRKVNILQLNRKNGVGALLTHKRMDPIHLKLALCHCLRIRQHLLRCTRRFASLVQLVASTTIRTIGRPVAVPLDDQLLILLLQKNQMWLEARTAGDIVRMLSQTLWENEMKKKNYWLKKMLKRN